MKRENYFIIRCLLLLAVFLVIAYNPAFTQIKEKDNCFILFMNAPSGTKIPTTLADEYEIGEMSWMADLGMEYKLKQIVSFSSGVGMGSIKDHASFTQNTTMGEKESTFTTFSYYFKTGIWIPDISLMKDRDLMMALGSNVGYEGLGGKREIEDCIDCKEEKFNFKGGFFLEPELNLFFFQNLLGVGTSYRYYFTASDLEYKIVILKLMLRIDQSK